MLRTRVLPLIAVVSMLSGSLAAADAPPPDASCHAPPPTSAAPCGCCASPSVMQPSAESRVSDAAMTQIATLAIDAAKRDAEASKSNYESFESNVKFVSTLIGLLMGFITALAAFFGLRGFSDIRKKYEKEFNEQIGFAKIRTAEVEFEIRKAMDETRKRFDELKGLQTTYQSLISDSLEVTRKLVLVETLYKDKPSAEQQPFFLEMLPLLANIDRDAESAGNARLQTWALSVQAYILGELGRYPETIDVESRALKIAAELRAKDPEALPADRLADKYYNLSCYQAANGNRAEALANLKRALQMNADLESNARNDLEKGEFRKIFVGDPEFDGLLAEAKRIAAPVA